MCKRIVIFLTLSILNTNCNTELFDTSQINLFDYETKFESVLGNTHEAIFENINNAMYKIIFLHVYDLSKVDDFQRGAISETALLYNHGNVLISPFSYGVAVAQTLLGVTEPLSGVLKYVLNITTEDQEYQIHNEFYKILKYFREIDDEFNLTARSGLFLDSTLLTSLKNPFEYYLRQAYNADIIPVDFRSSPAFALQKINSWCDEHTKGLTGPLLQSVPSNTAALMANTVYFEAEWEQPFSYRLTKPGIFYQTPTNPINITYLQCQFEDMFYAENELMKARILRLPYVGSKDNRVSMYVMLPTEGSDVNDMMVSIGKESINALIRSMTLHSVTVSLPKLNMIKKSSLKNIIKKCNEYSPGYLHGLSEKELLTMPLASDDSRFVVNDIVQQLSMNVNEKGTTASVVTSAIFDLDGNSVSFRVSKPYIFFIQHEMTGAVLFWGKIDNPNQ